MAYVHRIRCCPKTTTRATAIHKACYAPNAQTDAYDDAHGMCLKTRVNLYASGNECSVCVCVFHAGAWQPTKVFEELQAVVPYQSAPAMSAKSNSTNGVVATQSRYRTQKSCLQFGAMSQP